MPRPAPRPPEASLWLRLCRLWLAPDPAQAAAPAPAPATWLNPVALGFPPLRDPAGPGRG
ncbi:hypothetical protein [Falsiroseomonas selenitidurans]|uniref:Uncharacterized protein n=1 Tax=Falsiroseomonas selenitidurans TaxID=2716335 RepID=A0ABX1E8J0_9PROT|nr:hypothetical protein [Falsiroseomonas selenitidurans]NKC31822.1 hypothetical protein [Falsiroseomonas selenitidurans]